MNPYLENMRQMQKSASLMDLLASAPHAMAIGTAIHVGQNAAVRSALRGTLGVQGVGQAAERLAQKQVPGMGSLGNLGNSPVLKAVSRLKDAKPVDAAEALSTNFYRGLHDIHTSPVSQHLSAFASGMTVPEVHILHQEAHAMGAKLRGALGGKGLSAANLSTGEQQVMHHVLNGNYLQAHDLMHQALNNSGVKDAGLATAKALEEHTGIPLHAALSDPGASRMHLYRLQKAARSPRNWVTSNLLPHLSRFKPAESLSGIAGSRGGRQVDTALSGAAGAAVIGVAEPLAGVINGAKHLAVSTSPRVGALSAAAKLRAAGEVQKGTQMAAAGGVGGNMARSARELFGSPVIHGLQGQVREMTALSNNFSAHLSTAKAPLRFPQKEPVSLQDAADAGKALLGKAKVKAQAGAEALQAGAKTVMDKAEAASRYTSAKADALHSATEPARKALETIRARTSSYGAS